MFQTFWRLTPNIGNKTKSTPQNTLHTRTAIYEAKVEYSPVLHGSLLLLLLLLEILHGRLPYTGIVVFLKGASGYRVTHLFR